MKINNFYFMNFSGTKAFTRKKQSVVQLYDNKYWKNVVTVTTVGDLFVFNLLKDYLNIKPSFSLEYVVLLCFSLFFEYFLLTISANIVVRIKTKTKNNNKTDQSGDGSVIEV